MVNSEECEIYFMVEKALTSVFSFKKKNQFVTGIFKCHLGMMKSLDSENIVE